MHIAARYTEPQEDITMLLTELVKQELDLFVAKRQEQ